MIKTPLYHPFSIQYCLARRCLEALKLLVQPPRGILRAYDFAKAPKHGTSLAHGPRERLFRTPERPLALGRPEWAYWRPTQTI